MTTALQIDTGKDLLQAIADDVLPPPPAADLLGLDLEVVGDGETVFGFDARPEYGNPLSVHGGVLSAIADFAVSTAVWTQLPADTDVVTSDLHVSFLRRVPLDGARLTCRGRVLHLGATQANAVAEVIGPTGEVHVHALATLRLRSAG